MTSVMVAEAVPNLLTTTLAAALATCMACDSGRPDACSRAMAAITVSPAPETSNTDRARAGVTCT